MTSVRGSGPVSPRVLFLFMNATDPSARIRVFNLLPDLQKAGFKLECVPYPHHIQRKLKLLRECRKYDVVVVHRKLLPIVDTILLRRNARRLIFDFDDAIYHRSDLHSRTDLDSRSRLMKFQYLVRRADLVIAGNRILADYAKQFNRRVSILPSSVETRGIPTKQYGVPSDRTIIGWVGGAYNLHHLQLLTPVFQKLAGHHNIQVRILCSERIEIPSVDVRLIPWKLETQEAEIAACDIGVMPLPDNKSTEGKCGYKALQYMAAMVPTVVSDVGVNREIVEHGREGFVVKAIDDFYGALEALIIDKTLRYEMGVCARKKVERLYSVDLIGRRLAAMLRQCIMGDNPTEDEDRHIVARN
ncbi:MAG TPA: glycosyltransferase family 4 protein [Nitrospiria bacterium]|nr:glycosyltransferase family 4 protein [Nitrospiria bacterium]